MPNNKIAANKNTVIAALLCRSTLGLLFLFAGLNYFIPLKTDLPDPHAWTAMIEGSGYFEAIKILQALAGALLLSGRFTAVGAVLAAPIAVNILLFNLFLDSRNLGAGLVVFVLNGAVLWFYRSHLMPLFTGPPRISHFSAKKRP